MIVEPEIVQHPKYIALRAAVGDLAMEYLVRIWGHCQRNKKGHIWAGATPSYVEIVASGECQRGKLFQALLDIGWIHQTAEAVVIHDWEKHNASFGSQWQRADRRRNGPTQTAIKSPTDTPSNPDSNPHSNGSTNPPTDTHPPVLSCPVLSSPVLSPSSGTLPERERERAKRVGPEEMQASQRQAGVLIAQIRVLEKKRAEDGGLVAKEAIALREKKRALKEIQERQSRGDFSVHKT